MMSRKFWVPPEKFYRIWMNKEKRDEEEWGVWRCENMQTTEWRTLVAIGDLN